MLCLMSPHSFLPLSFKPPSDPLSLLPLLSHLSLPSFLHYYKNLTVSYSLKSFISFNPSQKKIVKARIFVILSSSFFTDPLHFFVRIFCFSFKFTLLAFFFFLKKELNLAQSLSSLIYV